MTCLRMFEIGRADETDTGISVLTVDLPSPWARRHTHAGVCLREDDYLGWGATLVGDGDQRLIGFPWYDHVDQMLVDADDVQLPPDLASGSWTDLEQGWWGSIVVDGDDIYIAETDLDALLDTRNPADLLLVRPGVVTVGGVEVLWNSVPREHYEAAWNAAIGRFQPS